MLDFIGIGGAFNTDLGGNCAYIKENNNILFIDLSLDSLRKINKYKLLEGIKQVYVLITHMHGDHIGCLPTFIQQVNTFLNIKVKIVNNSVSFTSNLKTLLNITGVKSDNYELINNTKLPFTFKITLKLTTHTSLLECYSVIFTLPNNKKILYTSDSNDLEFIKEKIEDENFIKIYTEAGENSLVHISFEQLKKLDKTKLILMHIESKELYKKIKKLKYKTPSFLK